MKQASTATQNILAAGEYTIAEIYDIQLASKYGSAVYHFTDFDVPLTAATYPSSTQFRYLTGLTLSRGDLIQKIGTDGAELELTIAPQWDSGAGSASVGASETIDTGSVTMDSSGVSIDAGFAATPSGGITFDSGSATMDSGSITIDEGGTDIPGAAPTIAGFPFLQACRLGILDGATITMSKLFFAPQSIDASPGAVKWFVGIVDDVQAGRLKSTVKASSPLSLMTVQMPRSLFQVGCAHQVYDAGCTLNRSLFSVGGMIGLATSASLFNTNLTQADNYFSKAPGQITFTSGANAGFTGSVKTYLKAGGSVQLFAPLPNVPQPGDTFTILPACDHLLATCSNTNPANGPPFNNRIHFKGEPFIPIPETMIDGDTSSPPVQAPGRQAGQIIGSAISSARSTT